MRIIVASPPKTGNLWVKSLLAETYKLEILDKPPATVEGLRTAIEKGWFVENAVFHQHFAPTEPFLELADLTKSTLVTTIRNPYDTFVSLYHFVQNFPRYKRPEDPLHVIYGKPIDHADVIDFIGRVQGGFGIHLLAAVKWMESGRTIIVRYEDLHADTFGALKALTSQIKNVEDQSLSAAIDACSPEKMRQRRRNWTKHIRKATVGDWHNHLNGKHLKEFKTHHADLIRKMGYDVK